jgi:hypothetical protein
MMLLSNKAVYSGKGTPMISKQGVATITNYSCFKQGLTKEEKKKTGLKPAID